MARLLQRLGSFSVRRRRLVLGELAARARRARPASRSRSRARSRTSSRSRGPSPRRDRADRAAPCRRPTPTARPAAWSSRPTAKLDEAAIGQRRQAARGRAGRRPPRPSADRRHQDGRIAYTDLQFTLAQADVSATQTDAIEQAAATTPAPQVEFGGSAAAIESEPPIGEVLGVLVAMIVLAITFGSLLAAGLPLLTALIGVGVGMLGIQLASGITDLTSTVDHARRDARPRRRHRLRAVHPLAPPHAGRDGHGHRRVDRARRRHGRQRRRVRRRDRDDRPRRARR